MQVGYNNIDALSCEGIYIIFRRKKLLFNNHQNGEIVFATDFNRIVHGERGSYFEFETEHLLKETVFIPKDQEWRTTSKWHKTVYYYEYRTKVGNLKLYYQRKTVTYADYIIGKWYVSTDDAYSDTPPTSSVRVINQGGEHA